jgi:fructuronate reductase
MAAQHSRLSNATLGDLPPEVAGPRGRTSAGIGIVHFGPGAFHRAHQAAYVDTLLADDPRWQIAAVSMRSRGTVEALAAQDGLYTLAIRDREPSHRVLGVHRAFLGPEDAEEVLRLLAAPATRLVTSTVTEKGYCLGRDGTLDLAHPDIAHDLAQPAVPRSLVGWLVRGLAARREAGTAPFTVMPCDNLPSNGRKVHEALTAFAREADPALADWIAGEVAVPGTMVDSITPASDEELYTAVAEQLGLTDRAAVQREAFAQWVIEDRGLAGGPDLAAAGAIVTDDVEAYEQAKLRVLNGAHSTLAYLGLLRGATSVADAMRDDALARFVESMMTEEVIPSLRPTRGLDLPAYAQAVLERFRNPAIIHRLDQIAQDGSQKLPYRLGDPLAAALAAGRDPRRITAAFGGWIAWLMRRAREGAPVIDPAGPALAAAAAEGSPAQVVARVAEVGAGLPPALAGAPALVRAAEAAWAGRWDDLL